MIIKKHPPQVDSKFFYQLFVDKSQIDGKGLFAGENISARTKIGNLGGEVISKKQARQRAKTLKIIAIVELHNGKAIDATNTQQGFKYINHSCSPNCFMRVINYQVEFYALRTINIGEEITCNYGETHHDGKHQCKCKSENCKGKI